MIKYKPYAEIETHVTKFKIRGWESQKNFRNENTTVIYKGIADGKRFEVRTNGHQRIADIIDAIEKDLKNELH